MKPEGRGGVSNNPATDPKLDCPLPVLCCYGDNLPQAWEHAVSACWTFGTRIPTQYDKESDPNSRDCFMTMVVKDAFAQPRFHKAIPAGPKELEAYVQEVRDGIHDHWIDPNAGKWEYTYHERLRAYGVPYVIQDSIDEWELSEKKVDQLSYVINALSICTYTRRAQAVLWMPWKDAGISDPACLQRLWFRIFGDELVLHVDMRSNDAFKATFMNAYAFTELQRQVAGYVSDNIGREIRPTQYIHTASSFHIYGSYFEEFEKFLESREKRPFSERTYRTDTPEWEEDMELYRAEIAESLRVERETGRKGL